MKILLFPAYYYPETAASSYLSENRNEAYVKSGMDIEIFTPMPCRGVSKDVREIYKQKKYEVLHDGHMIVHRFPMYAEGKNPIMRALRYFLCSCEYLYYGITIKNVDNYRVGHQAT